MMQPIQFFVPGIPKPAGSKRAFVIKGRAIVTDACKKSKDWKADVRGSAPRLEYLLSCPLRMRLQFTMPRPKSHFRTGKNAHLLRDDAPQAHVSKPDTTKLIRAVEDALTGVLWMDDSQIAEQSVTKRYGALPGVTVEITELEP